MSTICQNYYEFFIKHTGHFTEQGDTKGRVIIDAFRTFANVAYTGDCYITCYVVVQENELFLFV